MCTGAVYRCGIGRDIYALAETRLLPLTGDNPENPTFSRPCREVVASGRRHIDVVGPTLEDEAAAPHVGSGRRLVSSSPSRPDRRRPQRRPGHLPEMAGLAEALLDVPARAPQAAPPPGDLPGALLAGSCTTATLEQVSRFEARWPVLRFTPSEVVRGRDVVAETRMFAARHLPHGPVGVVASAPSDVVRLEQASLGRDRAASVTEETLAAAAVELHAAGARRLVVAGGETSGAVVNGCGITRATIGADEAPGVTWIRTTGPDPLWVLLKSGPLGDEDILVRALAPGG